MSTVLIIDSDADVANELAGALGAQGVETEISADGTEGLEVAKSIHPDVIVLCVELSRVSGYSICNKLKKNADLSAIPLILTSSQATDETFEQHKKLKTRAERYLRKPYDLAKIIGLMGEYIPLASAEDELEVSIDDVEMEVDAPAGLDDAFADEDLEIDAVDFGGATTVMDASQVRAQLAASGVEPAEAPVAEAPAGLDDLLIDSDGSATDSETSLPAAAAVDGRRSTAGLVSDAEVERLRSEIRQLRQKAQKLEQTMQEKELEFNDRLLQESGRAREAIEAKKRVILLEREMGKHTQAAAQAEEKLAEALRQAKAKADAVGTAEGENQALSDKIAQLVDKVKSLASERDGLRAEIETLSSSQNSATAEVEHAAKVREKARKAVDIAMQLLGETGMA